MWCVKTVGFSVEGVKIVEGVAGVAGVAFLEIQRGRLSWCPVRDVNANLKIHLSAS